MSSNEGMVETQKGEERQKQIHTPTNIWTRKQASRTKYKTNQHDHKLCEDDEYLFVRKVLNEVRLENVSG